MPVIIEIKAKCPNPEQARSVLAAGGARRVGLDHQIDTYFNVPHGRLKLRRGTIENNLIFYQRPDGKAPKRSDVELYPCSNPELLHDLLVDALGIWRTVVKRREIYFDDAVKLHVDEVDGLGSFVEIEVIDESGEADPEEMHRKCKAWMRKLGIRSEHLVGQSYSDLIGSNG